MKFDLRKPCQDCPFVKGSSTNISLAEGRIKGIIDDITYEDTSFTCHKTLGYDGKKVPQQHCAGAMIYLERIGAEGRPNQIMRIAERMGWYKRSNLELNFEPLIKESEYK
ncbi:hypothetical protein ABC382_00190 [Lysinibacillus sp. 1P01SD]|uniref:hypothetical protein n=1 Tax=Lysinibacillus sp. 1P01SD TaxID=3132285 RepID=UPI0039A0CEA7